MPEGQAAVAPRGGSETLDSSRPRPKVSLMEDIGLIL